MRKLSVAALLIVLLGLSVSASAQSCTGLCTQQVSCPTGTTTSISGVIYAPNGTDPLPNVQVYIPNAAVDAFTAGVSCPVAGQPPSGSPLVGTTTAVDGSFTINNVPVGTNIPLVAVTGRWRRQVVVPTTTACTTTAFSTRMPKNQTEGDIPKFAVATGSADSVECVLRKVGIDDAEFTDLTGTGRINLFKGSYSAGAVASTSTPSETTLMGTAATLNGYDVLMLPCEGGASIRPAQQLANIIGFANTGGRVYASHFSYVWMYQNAPWNTVANWIGSSSTLPDGIATVDTTFAAGATLAQWLQLIGASTTQGQIAASTVKHDFNGVNAPTQSWLTLNSSGNPVMQFVFDTPVGVTTGQCGKVLFNEYHVENPAISSPGKIFPAECTNVAMTPQEKLLEYSLFELTSDGGAPTLTPTSQDFGMQPVGFNSAAKSFTWTNNSSFTSSVSSAVTTGDFAVSSSNCQSVPAGSSCTINVVFNPTVIGAEKGTLTVASSGQTITATLTGTGIPDLVFSTAALAFGSTDVGTSLTKSIVVTNSANGSLPVPSFATTGDFATVSTCGASVAALSTCTINVVFTPTVAGPRTGTLTVNSSSAAYSGLSIALSGNGLDFSLLLNPTSGSVIAGYGSSTVATTAPLGGFASGVTLKCTTNAPASICAVTPNAIPLTGSTTATVTISTTSQYVVIGYSSFGGRGWMWLIAFGSANWIWLLRRRTSGLARIGLAALLMIVGGVSMVALSGCSGKLPAQNSSYTPPGTYTYTVTETDGSIVHTATYSLTVTAK